MNSEILKDCKIQVKGIYDHFDASHDWQHIERVMANAKLLMKSEAADPMIVELAVLLHDVSDPKYKKEGEELESEILASLELTDKQKDAIQAVIQSVSFSGGNGIAADTVEARIVQDADRLDALGAIGIARTFSYGGAKDRKLYDWQEEPRTQ
ncbi:MAG TPA: HD domain-containing protein, partial [Planococcus sp. (in: firmicutes)]|nr:HD domain-containing protein [Planococcus sp. (in: firmicutes)]